MRKREMVIDWLGRAYTGWLSHGERKQWLVDNFTLIKNMQFVLIQYEGRKGTYKIPLDKAREKWKDKENMF